MKSETKVSLRNKAHQIRPILELDEPFSTVDMGKTDYRLDEQPQHLIKFLQAKGAVEKTDRIYIGGGEYRYLWEWKPQPKEYMQTVVEQTNKLPCGCRAHIPPSANSHSETATCKYCNTEYKKETFKDSL